VASRTATKRSPYWCLLGNRNNWKRNKNTIEVQD
jgi:hypothetical protein